MTPSQKFLHKIGLKDPDIIEEQSENNETKENSRRGFLKKSALGGITLGGAFIFSPVEELIAQSTQQCQTIFRPFRFEDNRYALLCYSKCGTHTHHPH